MSKLKSLKQAIDLSLKGGQVGEVDCNFKIGVEGETWTVYTVSIAYRDIFCYADKGTATFLIDSYGDRHMAELFDWNRE